MRRIAFLLAAVMCAGAQLAAAQSGTPKKTDPGMPTTPPRVESTPADPGAVVTPPRTGTEEIVKTPNNAVDPKIDDATTDIDRKNRKRSEQKSGG